MTRIHIVALLVLLALPAAAPAQPSAIAAPAADPGVFDFFGGLDLDPSIPTPREHLGYDIGEHFTRHADAVAYLERLAAASDRVRIDGYGLTHQRRPLHVVTVSDPANLRDLDGILDRNRALADPATDPARVRSIVDTNPAVAWFSYNVHGNEPSPMECALQLVYVLAASRNAEVRTILRDVVLVVDPVLNPDGRERYVSWYHDTRGATPLTDPDAAEHHEPWPGGRTNHYLFDLNRDWLWLVQPESRQRLTVYRRFLPQLHIDHHEQGHDQPFFFGAGDEPYHAHIPQATREWVERYGQANAAVFDAATREYSTAERFDYLYPGYGKVLPVYHGAVGMLAEKAGHGRAGVAIDVNGDYVLTLRDRARDHYLLSLSNLETTARFRREQLERFRGFFDPGPFAGEHAVQAFLVSPANDPHLLERVWDICTAHGIEIHRLVDDAALTGVREYALGDAVDDEVQAAGTWVIPVRQPRGRLVATLFERETEVVDPDTYDITAWSLPLAFGLDARYATEPVTARTERLHDWSPPAVRHTGSGSLAVIVDAAQHRFPLAAAAVARRKLSARYAGEPFVTDGRTFAGGSLILHARRNDATALEAFLDELAATGVAAHRTRTGLTEEGPVIGANANERFEAPRVLLVRGRETSSNSFGQHWHLLDVEWSIPHVPVNAEDVRGVDLDDYTVILVPSVRSNLGEGLGAATVDRIRSWVREGGAVVGVGSGAAWASRTLLDLEPPRDETTDDRPPLSSLTWAERQARGVEERVPGSALLVNVDGSHPLAAGVPAWLGVLKRGSSVLPVADDGTVVARYDDAPRIGGVLPDRTATRLAGTPMMTHHRRGRGNVICIGEDVTFRGFQHGPMRLLLNALVYGGSL